jgi:hypothetical protein
MATTMKLIAKNVLGSDTSSVTFSSIPGTYTDLLLVCSVRSSRSASNDGIKARFNGAGSDTNHSSRVLVGDGSVTLSGTGSFVRVGYATGSTATSNTFGSSEMYIPNYAGSTAKSMSSFGAQEDNAANADMGVAASLWNSTAAITSIELLLLTGPNFKSGSSFFLYGITKA